MTTISTLVLIQCAVFYMWNKDRKQSTNDVDILELRRTYAWITVANIGCIVILTALKMR